MLEAEAQFSVAMEGLQVESFEISTGTAVNDLYFVLGRVGKGIAGRMEYNAALFKPETAARIAADWQVRYVAAFSIALQLHATWANRKAPLALCPPDVSD